MGNEKVDIVRVAQKPEKKTLLERYNIPIGHLTFEFISQCTNGKVLERIVRILRSGEEGIYPDLTKHAEECLANVQPTSAVLRKAEPVLRRNMLNTDERREIDDDLDNWMCEMRSREKDLSDGKAIFINDPYLQPEIRNIKMDFAKNKKTKINGKKCDKPKRISTCDYAAWDKYDADTEINRIDLQNEQRQVEMKRIQEHQKKLDKTNKMTFKTTVDKLSLTSTEINILAEQEREKGNEAFKALDYEEALRHYNASIDIDSNLNAYNNRAMTFIKLQRYEDALNDCNIVLTMDYRNVKALLRRALSLEHLEKAEEALADYGAVLKLEPTNKMAISSINKLKKSCKSRRIRMKIEEENINDNENKAERIKSEGTVKMNAIECPKQRVNSDICYCDRAPGSSRSIATKPHLKASYCVETESNKAATANGMANKSKEKITTRDCSSGNKLSPVTKDFGGRNKTSEMQDIITISRESLPRPYNVKNRLEKSIFSCVSSRHNMKPSIIIEELPNDESCEKSKKVIDSNKAKINMKKESIVLEKGSKTPNKNQLADEREKSRKMVDPSETRVEKNVKMNTGKVTTLIKKPDIIKNKKAIFPDKESKIKTDITSDKIINECQKESRTLKMDLQGLENIESPYEFLRLWQSLKDDSNLELHAKLLRCIANEDINKIIGNKLDAGMLSIILRCLEQQFCTPQDTELLVKLLYSLSRVNRFSIICMFMDSSDKKALENILHFLEKEDSSNVTQLRQIYIT